MIEELINAIEPVHRTSELRHALEGVLKATALRLKVRAKEARRVTAEFPGTHTDACAYLCAKADALEEFAEFLDADCIPF